MTGLGLTIKLGSGQGLEGVAGEVWGVLHWAMAGARTRLDWGGECMGMEVLGCDGLGSMPSLNNPWERGGVTFHSEKNQPVTGGKIYLYWGKSNFRPIGIVLGTQRPLFTKKIGHSPPPAGKKSARG